MVATNILILGGGFGGIRTALELDKKFSKKEASITLIDRNNCHLFLPALYEVASAFGVRQDKFKANLRKTVAIPYAEIFQDTKINFVQAEVSRVDLAKKEVESASGAVFPYDYLVLAFGAETETFNVKGVSEYAYKFKTVDEALFLNEKVIKAYKEAAEDQHALPLKFLIAGAGFNGLELGAELACCTKNISKSCKLKKGCTTIKLIEAGPQILPMISEKERNIVKLRLKKLGVEIMEDSSITEVGSDFVQIKNGEKIAADFIIWTAGIRASSFLKRISGLRLDERGRLRVNRFMQAEGFSEVFGVGDNTIFVDPAVQKPVPALAYVAVDQGKVVAENIFRILKNGQLKKYEPFYSVWIAPVGGKYAVAHLSKSFTVSGFWGWVIREIVDFKYLASILPFSKAVSLFSEEVEIFTKND